MQNDALQETTEILARNRRRKAWKKAVSVLACIVVFCTTYALILPALTMERTAYCGIEPHQHGSECYEKALICGQEETGTAVHAHTEGCAASEQRLICENEAPEHRHAEECYETVETYTCGMEEGESAGHVHADECYEWNLVCEKEEHTHELNCYSNPEADVESPEVWLRSISGVELTGNWRNDLIAVAESQLGYTESSQNYTAAENGGTRKGYTRYGAWYGDSYGDWCAMFVSFCLHYAGIPAERFPQEASCSRWADELQNEEYGLYAAAAGGYEPLVGDLVFFDRDGDGSCDHVGLVAERTEDEQGALTEIKTIEGNVDNQVKYVVYSIGDETILGYAALPDNPGEALSGLITQTFAGEDYTVTVTYGPEAKLPENVKLTAGEYAKDSERYRQRYAEAAELYGWEADQCDGVRLFNIGFYLDGEEIEPAAEVAITITYVNQEEAGNYKIICFGGEPKALETESIYEDGEQDIDFTLDHPSDIMAVAAKKLTQKGTVQGVTPNGTVINVFDYWLTDRNSPDSPLLPNHDKPTEGINYGHALKFTADGIGDSTNHWTGDKNPRTGLVESTLGSDGYPRLTVAAANGSGSYDNNPESLAYLFDPTAPDNYRRTFRNVGGLLSIDEQGYYYYDSQRNFAALDEEAGQFTLYDTWGVKPHGGSGEGQFFPFNKFEESQSHDSKSKEINHYFGMTMTSRFVQRYGGHTNTSRRTSTIFEFAGDDDVWVFIDGVLVGDLGGIHDRAKLRIDFASGEVFINDEETKTLKELFNAAGVETSADEWNGNTFADNTYHTLKFYYLERGNYDSNMLLKYNLTMVPATTIYKTNQYGRPIKDVEFTVYKADGAWNYDENNPVYTGTTDGDGALTFVDDDNMPYTLKELKDLFGTHCVLKETDKPPGYRLVGTEVHLRISDKTLWCDNTYESGVWAMVTLQVAAPTTLQLAKYPDEPPKNYYAFDDVTTNGTLFGVVVKRVGKEPISELTSWAPVSGNSTDGYVVHHLVGNDVEEKEAYFKETAIEIAKKNNSVFEMAPSGAMEMKLLDLPGHITEYLYMLGTNEKEDAQFTTVYYWTEADSLKGATPENTFRVNSDAAAPCAFDRTFGAIIEVPNLGNRLLVQKFDKNGNKINGAIFALFRANENGAYIADDKTEVTLVEGEYTIEVHFDGSDDTKSYAVITTKDGKTITSVEQRRTNSDVLKDSDGTCVFGIRQKALEAGCYYLREVEPPTGYKINTKPVMVRVTDNAIYANAGAAGDGIQVARGPGYISSTLHKAASIGDVDNTLTWIYQKLRVSGVSTSFAEAIPVKLAEWSYAKNDEGLELASYLQYDRTPQSLGADRYLANYVVDEENPRPAIEGTVRTHTQQIATDVGWSYNEIYQDYNYGKKRLEELGSDANYTDLQAEGDISNLFSRSVYVWMTDEPIFSDLEISKTVTNAPEGSTDVFTFTVNVESATGAYDYDIYNVSDRLNPIGTGTISNGDVITLKDDQVAVIKALPGRARYTVTETPVSCYNASYVVDGAKPVAGFEAGGKLNWEEGENGNRVSKVAFTNAYVAPLNLTLKKYATGTTLPLNGAKFVLYTVKEDSTLYYYDKNGNWVTLSDGKTLESLAHTTGEGGQAGIIVFTGLPDGVYTLKEIAAPNGYHLPEKEITFTVSGGKVVAGADFTDFTESSITVYNNTAHELPETGGGGVRAYITGGALLTGCAGTALLYIKRKRRREDSASS